MANYKSTREQDEDPVLVSWTDINYQVRISDPNAKPRGILGRLRGGPYASKPVLENVSGYAEPGEILFIMGATGAGKTSLLNVLAQRTKVNTGDELTGELLLDGTPYNRKSHQKLIGYVMQDDAIFHQFTPRECLDFAVRMKFRFNTKAQYAKKVDELLSTLHLHKCADTLVGDPLKRGISGGERKRTSVGIELVSGPRVLFLDEPTSGLDSINAENVLRCLRKIARSFNTTIITTIHQPNTICFNLSDRLTLLQDGRTVYQGRTCDAVSYYSSLGFTCPQTSNPADFFMQLLNTNPCENFLKVPHGESVISSLTLSYEASIAPTIYRRQATIIPDRRQEFTSNQALEDLELVTIWSRWWAMCVRETRLYLRSPKTFWLLLVGKDLVLLLLYSLYYDMGTGVERVMNLNGFYFFVVICEFFTTILFVSETLPVERPIFLRETGSGMYSPLEYVNIKFIATLPLFTFATLHWNIILFWIVDIDHSIENFWWFISTIYVLTFVSISMGTMIGCITKDVETTMLSIPMVSLPLVTFGGYYSNINNMTWALRWLAYCSPIRYAFEAVMVSEYNNSNLELFFDPLEELSFTGPPWKWILVLVGMAIFLRFATMYFIGRGVASERPKGI